AAGEENDLRDRQLAGSRPDRSTHRFGADRGGREPFHDQEGGQGGYSRQRCPEQRATHDWLHPRVKGIWAGGGKGAKVTITREQRGLWMWGSRAESIPWTC